ncbi:GDP-L-fucose synthase family protein [Massilibacteroides vaginae]|uniref:GDP-L-fucose synthase family protein n=1 Tax=Massilibacteroides vaginae TaxID=1673718 RepID=UPI000A1CB65D|nr:GDP-L-fucose synthase [Massilibacteroides vaginae]
MNKESKIFVAGHRGLVGSAILKNLKEKGFQNFVLKTHAELDLTNQDAVNRFFAEEKPEYIFLSAAHVGGIMANNTYRGDFIYRNLMIQNNVIHASYVNNAKKLLFLGSTCIYPREAPQPMNEACLLTSPLEYTNEPYAIAKIAGIKLCESYNLQYGTNFIAVMPTNLYGPNDNFNLETSHVLPAIIRKMHLAHCLKSGHKDALRKDLNARPVEGVNGNASDNDINALLSKYGITENHMELWGTGKPMREFLWSEEMADACVFVMQKIDFKDLVSSEKEIRNTHINIGTGKEISIKDVALLVQRAIGYEGKLIFNTDKPDGTLRKLTDVSKLNALGWKHSIEIEEGVERLYKWYIESISQQ